MAREVGDDSSVGTTLGNLGHVALLQRDFERAKARSEEALAFADELGSAGVEIVPSACVNLGLASLGLGKHERAMGSFEEALLMSQDMGRTPQVIEALEGMASLAGAMGRPLTRHACGEQRRRHARLPASVLSHPTSGRCTSHTWPWLVPSSGIKRGKKRWPRDRRCRWRRQPNTPSERRPIRPWLPLPKST